MRQHPIPHNILDIEFKLFGKFSAKQFGYIAVGAVTGGIFLLLRSNGAIPDVIAWPAFLIFSGLGAFFGMVPINDQGSDTIVMNFINAINRPTRRVWKNAQFNQKLEVIAKEREIEVTRGSLSRAGQDQAQASIVGSGPAVDSASQFATSEVIDSLDTEEAERLNQIAQLAQQVQTVAPMPTQVQQPTPQQHVNSQVVAQVATAIQAPVPVQANPQSNNQAQTPVQMANPSQPIQTATAPIQTQGILITSDTANNLPTPQVNIQTQANVPYIQYLDNVNNPIPHTLVLIKKENGTVVQAHQTNPDGLIIPSRPLEKGNYIVEIQGGGYNLPSIKFVADDKAVKPIQIKAR